LLPGLYLNPQPLPTARNHTTAPVKGVRPMGKHSDNLMLAGSRFGGEQSHPTKSKPKDYQLQLGLKIPKVVK